MRRYLQNRWIRIAIGVFILGSVPLAALALLAVTAPPLAVAFPIGELLWLVTFWPAVLLLAAGIDLLGDFRLSRNGSTSPAPLEMTGPPIQIRRYPRARPSEPRRLHRGD